MRESIKTWSLVAVIALSVVVVVLHIVELPAVSAAARRLVDATHAPGFGLVALVALLFFRQRAKPLIAYLSALGFVFVLALGSEAVQIIGPRNADLADFGRGMLGAIGFLALVASSDPKLLPMLEFLQRNPRETLDQMTFPPLAVVHGLLDRHQALRRSYRHLPGSAARHRSSGCTPASRRCSGHSACTFRAVRAVSVLDRSSRA